MADKKGNKMRNRLLAAIGVATAALAVSLPASAATNTHMKPSFTTDSVVDNVKIQGWDGNCLTYAQPVAGSTVGVAPCNGGHNWDWVTSSDGTAVVFKVHGENLALGDSGGSIVLKSYNMTSDALQSPQHTQFSKNGVEYEGYAFAQTNPNFVYLLVNADNSVTPTTAWTIHCDYRSFTA